MKRYLTLLIVFLLATAMSGQQMTITDFELNLRDQTANNEDTKVIDDNGNPCALLKIETLQKNFSFDGGSVGIAKVEENHKGEIWVYVPANLRRITIAHDQLGILRDYVFPETLQPARTYIMKLVSGTVQTVVNQKSTSQFFVLTFTPKNAMVEIDGTMVDTEDGSYSNVLSFGRHEYRISAKNYHPEAGTIMIGEQKQTKNIDLRPAFGWIEIKGPNGASVYIDGEKVGVAPMKSEPVASGSHDVRVTKEKYLPYRDQVLVNDNTVTPVNPTLVANFVTVTLKTVGDAEIWINGEKKGNGSMVAELTPGEYSFETKKPSHRSQSVVRNITMSSGGTIDLPAPVAIVGSIMVNVKPVGAKVTVDGKPSGESPVILDNILVGTHDVVISKAGCAERRERVTVTEGQTTTLDGRLSEGQDVRLSCGVPEARWTVDGIDRGTGAEITVNLSYAEHDVVIKAEEYNDFSERFTVGTGTTYKSFAIQRRGVETITVNGVTFRMRRVEGGTFQMALSYIVTLSDYYIGETEVTQALWKAVMGENPSWWKSDNLPVECVSWKDCQKFIKKLNKLTGRTFALPTEAQWEYAARGGNQSRGYTYSGSNNIGDVAWYTDNSSSKTHQVGTKQANELGLYDMSGNVCEWCQDWCGLYPSSSQTDPAGPSSGSNREFRGGGWYGNAHSCRSTIRYSNSPGYRDYSLGLRLVLLI